MHEEMMGERQSAPATPEEKFRALSRKERRDIMRDAGAFKKSRKRIKRERREESK